MDWCKEVGQWIHDHIEQALQQFLQDAYQACSDAAKWIETQIVTPIETWEQRLEQQCREQECQWLCLCCNKWLCWLVAILVKVITYIIQTIGEWVIETICKLIVTIIAVILIIIVEVLKWVVLTLVCLLGGLCSFIFLLAGIALIAVFLSLVALPISALVAMAMPILPVAVVAAVIVLAFAHLFCEASLCRILRVIAWALKWSIAVGVILSLIFLSALSALVVAILGGCIAALINMMENIVCQVPKMLEAP